MKKLTPEELKQIIENHGHWLREDCDGWQNLRAYLSGADLGGANLSGADLSCAYLSGADLGGADLSGAYLSCAYLSGADLSCADLSGAYLRGADLSGADLSGAYLSCAYLRGAYLRDAYLRGAYLSGADLRGADFSGADLGGADLGGANLSGADLSCADLSCADLSGADLSGAYLRDAKNIPFIPMACPDTGAFIGWKKVNGFIVKLQIPEDARRSSATSTKCRCDKAFVLAIENADGTPADKASLVNDSYAATTYTVGEMVYPDSFDENRFNECSHGIHFFINRQEAVGW